MNCRGDATVACKRHPHIRICDHQVCDEIVNCPMGEDEEDCSYEKRDRSRFLFFDLLLNEKRSTIFFFCSMTQFY